jgi:4-diphosphocytidyl-2-C-methyl-D-erythritol kinase
LDRRFFYRRRSKFIGRLQGPGGAANTFDPMTVVKASGCKINLLLNVLGRRDDGFHELETVMHPIPVYDELAFSQASSGIELTCSDAGLPVDAGNLVYRATALYLKESRIDQGVRVHLQKRIPLAAGLGGGSGNAATTLLGLNELFGSPLTPEQLNRLAASLGSDVPFFLQANPALATGRGEKIEPLGFFPALKGAACLLIHPGFGVASAWAYQQLHRFPQAVNGRPGRAQELVSAFAKQDLKSACSKLYNSLEFPVLEKFPLLALFQDFCRETGAAGSLMSGSGSTTFAILEGMAEAERLLESFKNKFGHSNWTAVVKL